MSVPFIVWFVIGLVCIAALLAVSLALVRHLKLLSQTLGEFQKEVTPLAGELSAEANRASSHAARLGNERPFGRS